MASFITRIFGGKKERKSQRPAQAAPKAQAAPAAKPKAPAAEPKIGATPSPANALRLIGRLKRPKRATKTKYTGALGLSTAQKSGAVKKYLTGE